MSWNYRIVVENKGKEEEFWSIREVYYNKQGLIYAMTEESQSPIGEDMEELKEDFLHMQEAFHKDVIVLDNFKFAEADYLTGEEEEIKPWGWE